MPKNFFSVPGGIPEVKKFYFSSRESPATQKKFFQLPWEFQESKNFISAFLSFRELKKYFSGSRKSLATQKKIFHLPVEFQRP